MEKIGIEMGLGFKGIAGMIITPIMTACLFPIWFGASVALLCMMEGLSAYLHCLRLCWIEFNSKFFEAEGTAFTPMIAENNLSIEDTCGPNKDK
jgi:V-type H+-transporting ATPase subunit a